MIVVTLFCIYTLKGSLINKIITYPKLITKNFKILEKKIKYTIIKQIDKNNRNGNKIPILPLYFLYILLNEIFEITLTILKTHDITPIINAVFSTLNSFNNSC